MKLKKRLFSNHTDFKTKLMLLSVTEYKMDNFKVFFTLNSYIQ